MRLSCQTTNTTIFLLFIAYSITRHHLFNIRIIAIELVTFGLWITLLIQALLAKTQQEMLIAVGLLVVTVIFGLMLIRSTLQEIKQHEYIEKLATDLQKAYASLKDLNGSLERKVAEQTKEVKRAYEVEKRAHQELVELNATKDKFITSTQHHLRTPMTTLKWELESIRSGTCGPISTELVRALDNIDVSIGQLTHIIENFINITEGKI